MEHREYSRWAGRSGDRCHNILHPSDFLKITSQNAGNSIPETLDIKFLRGSMPPNPPKRASSLPRILMVGRSHSTSR